MDLGVGVLFGRYRLEARLGGGSFGSVWRAVDSETGQVVALKILAGSYSESEGAQLRTDVEVLAAAAAAGSTHVVRVLGGGFEPAAHVVMEYLDGTDLAASLAARGKIPQPEVIGIAEAVADALCALARVGIIHRDVKPANIMLCADGTTKLTDFGIAKIVGFDIVTSTGQLPLTMAYAAPEVWDGKATGSSDIYALGVVLYQCLTGKLPFTGTYSQVYKGHRAKRADLDLLPSDTVPALRSLIETCMAKKSDSRPADAESILAQLFRARSELEARRGATGGHPPVAFGPWQIIAPHPTRAWAWAARHEETDDRAIVEVCFGETAELGETLRLALEANPDLVDLGAESLLGTNRLILRPDEAWPTTPPSGPFAFWVAREELPIPPPVALGPLELRRVVESVDAIVKVAGGKGVRLDLGPSALVTFPDGSIHVRRPGLPPSTNLEPDAAALDSIRRLPLDLALTKTVARAPDLASLRRELTENGTITAEPSGPELEATITLRTSTPAQTVEPEISPTEPRPARRRRQIGIALLFGGLVVALLAATAFGAFVGSGPRSSASPSGLVGAIGNSSSASPTAEAPTLRSLIIAGPSGSASSIGPSTTPTATPTSVPTRAPTRAPTLARTPAPTIAPTLAPTVAPTLTTTPSPATRPATPTGATAVAVSSTAISVTWDASQNVTGYQVSDNESIAAVGSGLTTYDWPVTAGKYKCFHIRGLNSAGYSGWTGWACTTAPGTWAGPATPTNVVASSLSSSQISLTWTNAATNATGYRIQRWNGVVWATIADGLPANSAAFVDGGLSPGASYHYGVCAYNSGGESCAGEVSATTSA
jgi:hypothetical protein